MLRSNWDSFTASWVGKTSSYSKETRPNDIPISNALPISTVSCSIVMTRPAAGVTNFTVAWQNAASAHYRKCESVGAIASNLRQRHQTAKDEVERCRIRTSNRHLRRRHEGEAAEIREIVELRLTGAGRVVAAIVNRESVSGRGHVLQRIEQRDRRAGDDRAHGRGHPGVNAGSEGDRALLKIHARGRPVDDRRGGAGADGTVGAEGILHQSAAGIVERVQAGRLIDVARHVDVEQDQIGIDRKLRAGAPNLVDDAEAPLEQQDRTDRCAADRTGEEDTVAYDLGAIERTVAQRLQERRTAGD